MRRTFHLGLGKNHIGAAVDEELRFHVEMREQQLRAAGLSEAAARAEALRHFGDFRGVRQSCVSLDEDRERIMKRVRYVDELRQDVGFALRALRRNPSFALIAVLTLAVGIGANTAIFSLIDALVLRPLPVSAPQELVALGNTARTGSMSNGSVRADLFSAPLYRDLRDHNTAFTGLLASGRTSRLDVQIDSGAGTLEHPAGRFVSGNYFRVLGVPARIGRMLDSADDEVVGAAPIVVISDAYWLRRFSGDRSIIGHDVTINGTKLTVVGVAAAGFTGDVVGKSNDIWLPLSVEPVVQPHAKLLDNRASSWLLLLGRRRPGITFAQAQARMVPLVHQMLIDHATFADDTADLRRIPVPIQPAPNGFSTIRKTYQAPLLTLLGGVALLLLIICANVANLLLARAIARTPEISIRLAMGAGRGRLLRQLMTESAVLALASAALGLALAWAGSKALIAMAAAGGSPIPLDFRLDSTLLTFTLGATLLSVVLFGLLPAWRASRLDLAGALRARGSVGSSGGMSGGFPVGRATIAAQIALSLMLLTGAAVLTRSLRHLETTAVGVDRDHLLIVTVDSRSRGYGGDPLATLTRNLMERLSRVSGVASVSYSENGLFSGSESNNSVRIAGWSSRTPDDSNSWSDQVGPRYAATIGARLLAGRDLASSDDARGIHHALVNESFSRFYFGRNSPVGRSFRLDDTTSVEVVGVIADVRDHALDALPLRRFYTVYDHFLGGLPVEINFEIRTVGDPARATAAVRAAIAAEDPLLAIESTTLRQSMAQSIAEQRLLAHVASGFGVLALLLAAVGLYGVMTYAMSRRIGELGLRMALGARPGALMTMVLREALGLVGLGAAAGIPLAMVLVRLLKSQLSGVGATDPGPIVVALVVLLMAVTIAAVIPAARVTRISPLMALRHD